MKQLAICGAAVAAMFALNACQMCSERIPNEPTCIEKSHKESAEQQPEVLARFQPKLAESLELFRPVFKAGTKRVTVSGEGTSRESALSDAVDKFLKQEKCDYIVAVTAAFRNRTHPTNRFRATTNYSVSLSGIPIFLDSLSCEKLTPKKAEKAPASASEKKAAAEANGKCEKVTVACQCKPAPAAPALIKLSDIQVDIKAKGATDDKAGVLFPAK